MFYRFSNSGPISPSGHALFSTTRHLVKDFGINEYRYDGKKAILVDCIMFLAYEKWLTKNMPEMTWEKFTRFLNPYNIVKSAGIYDSKMFEWLHKEVILPNNIKALLTLDGAVVFDESLIEPY